MMQNEETAFPVENSSLLSIQSQKPLLITIICILGLISSCIAILFAMLGLMSTNTNYLSIISSFVNGTLSLFLYISLWNMKKWAAIGIFCLFVISLVTSVMINQFDFYQLIASGVIAIILLFYIPQIK